VGGSPRLGLRKPDPRRCGVPRSAMLERGSEFQGMKPHRWPERVDPAGTHGGPREATTTRWLWAQVPGQWRDGLSDRQYRQYPLMPARDTRYLAEGHPAGLVDLCRYPHRSTNSATSTWTRRARSCCFRFSPSARSLHLQRRTLRPVTRSARSVRLAGGRDRGTRSAVASGPRPGIAHTRSGMTGPHPGSAQAACGLWGGRIPTGTRSARSRPADSLPRVHTRPEGNS
jgi:hypothetical protein